MKKMSIMYTYFWIKIIGVVVILSPFFTSQMVSTEPYVKIIIGEDAICNTFINQYLQMMYI